MTTVVLLADPPIEGVPSPELQASVPLNETEFLDLYEAMLGDVCEAVEGSGGELLINYRPREHLDVEPTEAPKSAIEAVVSDAVSAPETVRYEVQVGSNFDARVGNTVTHLLEREDEASVHVLEPTVPLVTRQSIDSASMKLRRTPVVLAPAAGGRVGYAGFRSPIDFEDAFAEPAVETLVDRALDATLDVDFLAQLQPVETPSDLATIVSVVRARARAGRKHPERTHETIERFGLRAVQTDEGSDTGSEDGASLNTVELRVQQ